MQTVRGRMRMYQPAQKPATKKLTKNRMMSQIRPQKRQPTEPVPLPILPEIEGEDAQRSNRFEQTSIVAPHVDHWSCCVKQ